VGLSERFWDNLLDFIHEGTVIPVVGPELLRGTVDGREMTLYAWLAEQLAAYFDLPPETLQGDPSLGQMASRCMHHQLSAVELYPAINRILTRKPFPLPVALRQLAEIRNFNLFVATTFDGLMARALDEVRFAGEPRTRRCSYSLYRPRDETDLPRTWTSAQEPLVFRLFGEVSVSPDFVVTEADLLEFVTCLLDRTRRPDRLCGELKRRHLLLLGNSFPDWLGRFFLRLVRDEPFSSRAPQLTECLADGTSSHDEELIYFLESFSAKQTTVVRGADAAGFVAELSQRWKEDPRWTETGQTPGGAAPVPAEPVAKAGLIFISYASQDRAAADRLRDHLAAENLPVWLDVAPEGLQAADLYERKIRSGIERCALFMPVLSAQADRRQDGFFRKEWHWAIQRLPNFTGTNRPFLVPVIVDDLDFHSASVPEDFRSAQAARLPGGETTPEFRARLKQLVREVVRREQGYQ
jgi:hypothetical protein